MKYTLHHGRGESELDAERILTNDVTLPGEHHPHNMRLWVIGNEYGAICAVWADCEQDALDIMVDEGLGNSFLVEDPHNETTWTSEERESWTGLGNASEPCDLEHCWMAEVTWDIKRDFAVLLKFAEARGANCDNLDDV